VVEVSDKNCQKSGGWNRVIVVICAIFAIGYGTIWQLSGTIYIFIRAIPLVTIALISLSLAILISYYNNK